VVLVFQPVSIELYEVILSAFHAGLRVMLADPSAGKQFLSLCCERLRPDAFFGSWKAQCLRLAVGDLRKIPLAIRSGGWFPGTMRWRTDGNGSGVAELPDDEPGLITFTSGSTGVPKAAVRTHGFLLAQHRTLSHALDFRGGEVDLITLPVFVLANLASGLTSVLAATDLSKPGTPDIDAVKAQCARHAVTRCAASPAFFDAIQRSGKGLPSLEKVFTGGAPVFPDLLRRLRKELPDAVIDSVYGSTEAEPIAHFSADEADAETDSLTLAGAGLCSGTPVADISLRVIADSWGQPLGPFDEMAFDALAVPHRQAGEIVVAGDHVLQGYLGGIGDTETKIRVSDRIWHRTGDAGWMDEMGRIWLLGRCSEKLPVFPAPDGLPDQALRYPFAVECALRERFPGVRIAAMNWKGSRALVIEGEEIAGLREAAAALGMADLRYVPRIPLDRRHNAKIDYPALRLLLETH
jgi:acyl-CoA synthetase (AMP-forming)/AMP-acid ligase II